MGNKEFIRRLINFDEEVEGIDPSTSFNSVTSYDDSVRPEDSEDLFRQMVSELGDGWEYDEFEYNNELELYKHSCMNH